MAQFVVQTSSGKKPPTFIHHDFNLAMAEANRLKKTTNCKWVRVLEIVGVIETKEIEVPVTRIEIVTEFKIDERFKNDNDDLPF